MEPNLLRQGVHSFFRLQDRLRPTSQHYPWVDSGSHIPIIYGPEKTLKKTNCTEENEEELNRPIAPTDVKKEKNRFLPQQERPPLLGFIRG